MLEDVALLLQAPDALSELAQLLALGAGQPVIALTAVALALRRQLRSVCCDTPRLSATSGIERP